jgi:hypothetical protein
MELIRDVERAARAAGVTDPSQLPDHLRGPAAKLLADYAKSRAGYSVEQIAGDVAGLLAHIAFYLPDQCPTLEQVEAGWPWEYNHERRRDLAPIEDGRFSHALLLREAASGSE